MAYIGSRPDNVISRNAQNEYNYTATGGQTTFTGADSNNNTLSYTPGNIEVYFNGARLEESDFTATNGTSIVLANAAVVNDELSIVAMRVFEVGSISNFNTSDLAEGSNLYFTNARADARIAAADTDDLSEGSTNLYFTNARADARIAAADTDDLSEGSTNLYFTNARVAGYLSSNDFDTATNIVASITDSAPSTLDTLNELAAALGDDPNFATTTANNIATKLPLSGGTMTGVIAGFESTGIDDNASATAITIASDGKVVVGGATPYARFTSRGTLGNGTAFGYIDDWGVIGNSYNNSVLTKLNWAGSTPGSRIQGFEGSTQKFQISANSDTYFNGGNIGIGTDTPLAKLDVRVAEDTLANVLANETYAASFLSTTSGNTGHTTAIMISGSDDTNRGVAIAAQTQSTSNDHDLIFATNSSGSTPVERVRITSDGKVGIGTTSPGAPLEVHHASLPIAKIKATSSAGQASLYLDGYHDGGSTHRASRINFRKDTTTEWSIINDYTQNDSNTLDFEYAGSRKITFTGNGKVGIGTSSPGSYYANHLVVDTGSSVQSGISIVSGTSAQGMLAFADGTSGNQRYRGAIDYNHSNDRMGFLVVGQEQMSLQSTQTVWNGGNQSYSDNYRQYAHTEDVSSLFNNTTLGAAQTITVNNTLPYQKIIPVVVAFSYNGNGALSYTQLLLVNNSFNQITTNLIDTNNSSSGIVQSTSYNTTGSYNTRKLQITLDIASSWSPSNWNCQVYYGVAFN